MLPCINQIFRPKFSPGLKIAGKGDCRVCTMDEKNKECPAYTPIKILIFEIKGGENEKDNQPSLENTF